MTSALPNLARIIPLCVCDQIYGSQKGIESNRLKRVVFEKLD